MALVQSKVESKLKLKFIMLNSIISSHKGRSPGVTLPFEPETYQVVEFDELIIVVCSVFPHRLPLKS